MTNLDDQSLLGHDNAVHDALRIQEKSRRSTVRCDPIDLRPLAGAGACARRIEGDELTLRSAHITVTHLGLVHVKTGGRADWIDAEGERALIGVWNAARTV